MATREQIEALVEADPSDDAAYLVLADVLQLEGDPRGELIALDAAALDPETRNRRRHALLQRHPGLAPGRDVHCTWHLGFVRQLRVGAAVTPDVLAHPALRYLTELVFPHTQVDRFAATLNAFVARLPRLRYLALGDPEVRHGFWPRDRVMLDLAPALARLPYLEHLFVAEPVEFGQRPRLRRLQVADDPGALQRLRAARLPALEALELHEPRLRAVEELRWLCEAPPPGLVELALSGVEAALVVEALAGTPLLAQLRELRIIDGGVTPEVARQLARSCAHLALLDVSDPLISDEVIAILGEVCPEVRTISPWMREILQRPG